VSFHLLLYVSSLHNKYGQSQSIFNLKSSYVSLEFLISSGIANELLVTKGRRYYVSFSFLPLDNPDERKGKFFSTLPSLPAGLKIKFT